MKQFFNYFLLFYFVVAQNAYATQPLVLDTLLVRVNDEFILLSDVQQQVKLLSNGQASVDGYGKVYGEKWTALEVNQVLEQLIDQKILSLKVKELGLTVSPSELENEIEGMLREKGISKEQLNQKLVAEGLNYERYTHEFQNQLETQRFIGKVIRPMVSAPSEEELASIYLKEQQSLSSVAKSQSAEQQQMVKLRSLAISMPQQLTEYQLQNKKETIEKIATEVQRGTDFKTLVRLYSQSSEAPQTEGLLPSRPVAQLPAELREKLKNAKINDVIGPISLGSSTFFFQLVERDMNDRGEFLKQKPSLERKAMELKFQAKLKSYLDGERRRVRIVKSKSFLFT